MDSIVALVGLGVVGSPIAYELQKALGDNFVILSDELHYEKIKRTKNINDCQFKTKVVTSSKQINKPIGLLIIAVKNYDLITTLNYVEQFITDDTVIVPLQNGIWSGRYLRNKYSNNIVTECYVRGPNTQKIDDSFKYTESGVIHIGTSRENESSRVKEIYTFLKNSNLNIYYEDNIKLMVWKKWMLNVAGNTVTALTGANYNDFAENIDIQILCRKIMKEFLIIANEEGVDLTKDDINETIDYFVGFQSGKVTSMLEDVLNMRRTENEYITGELLRIAQDRGIVLPINQTLYELIKLKEKIYMKNKKFEKFR